MKNKYWVLVLHFFLFVAIQTLVLNRVDLGGYASPFFYILFIINFPLIYDRVAFLFVCFLLGMTVDIFSNTSGVNAFASVVMAVLQRPMFQIIILDKQTHLIKKISLSETSLLRYLTFVSVFTFTHHFMVLSLEVFSLRDFATLFWQTVVSTLMTVMIIMTIAFFSVQNKKL